MDYGIIAAGEGSRLVEEGVEYPKPLVPLDGRPMIGRLIDIFCRNDARKIVIIVNEQMTEVRDYLYKLKYEIPVDLEIVVKSTPSSMHSLYELSKKLDKKSRFIVTTVDTIFREEEFSNYVKAYSRCDTEVDGMMALTRYIDDEKPLYVECTDAGKIAGFLDRENDNTRFVSGGIYGLGVRALTVLENCMENGISRMRNFQRELLAAGLEIKGYDMGKIIDVDHAGDIRKAEEFIKEN